MNRGHKALELLREILAEIEKRGLITRAAICAHGQAGPLFERAIDLTAQARVASKSPRPSDADPDWCASCDAIHRRIGVPESHGERRS